MNSVVTLALSLWPVLRDVLVVAGSLVAFTWMAVFNRRQRAQEARLAKLTLACKKVRSETQQHHAANLDPSTPSASQAPPVASISVAELYRRERGGGPALPGPISRPMSPHTSTAHTGRCADLNREPGRSPTCTPYLPGGR